MPASLRQPGTQKIVLGAVLGLAVLYAYFMTDVAPFTYKAKAAEITELSERYRSLHSDLTKARQTLDALDDLERESTLLHQKWDRAQRMLPGDEEMASLLRAMTLLGEEAGVEFVLFKPQPARPSQYYTEHPIEVTVEGGYHEVGSFLGALANMERMVTIADLTMETAKEETADETNTASASFIARTFTLGGTGVAPPDEKVGTAAKAAGGAGGAVAKAKSKIAEAAGKKQRGGTIDE